MILTEIGPKISHQKLDEGMGPVIAKKSNLWFGMLEAGVKSSPVVRDPALETGIPTTIYLFNHKRGAIREYQLSIVEKILRELTIDEQELVGPLEEAFQKARNGFVPRYTPPTRTRSRRPKEIELPEIDSDSEPGDDEPFPPTFQDNDDDETDQD